MTHLDLFAGIGGFSLAARWAGWKTIAWCEINPFCQKTLKHHFPDATGYEDIKRFDATGYAGRIDIITGGFPCQPYSSAGKRLGKEDERHLWPEMLRIIREVSPRWVVGENVRGITSWSDGLVFDEVQTDLEAAGYEVQAFILPAASVNAPHERYRTWFVAHAGSFDFNLPIQQRGQGKAENTNPLRGCKSGTTPNAKRCGQQGQGRPLNPCRCAKNGERKASWADDAGRWPTESPLCSGNDGIPSGLAGITVSKHSEESLKGYGNAIVPQVAWRIFDTINQYEGL
ncbi:MAG: DNA cytosine methyltransferase [Saprospiraceae bacterium]|nr:DNA cytosine methyltransferase [Saprospiraceae bacterium]